MSFKICLIGCGYMTKAGHGPACHKYASLHSDAMLAACCDINIDAAREVSQKFGFLRVYTDYKHMIDIEKPDVVMVITPEHLTKQVSIDVINSGCAVFLEKPPGLNRTQAEQIHTAALDKNIPARVAFNRRYMPIIRRLKDEIAGLDKPISHINYMFVRHERMDADFAATAIHGIDTACFIADSGYVNASFRYQDVSYHGKIITNTTIGAVFENGATAALTFMPVGGCRIERATVILQDTTYFLELPFQGGFDNPGRIICIEGNEITKNISGIELVPTDTFFESNGFYDESASFFDLLRSGKRPVSDIDSGFASVDISSHMRDKKMGYIRPVH